MALFLDVLKTRCSEMLLYFWIFFRKSSKASQTHRRIFFVIFGRHVFSTEGSGIFFWGKIILYKK